MEWLNISAEFDLAIKAFVLISAMVISFWLIIRWGISGLKRDIEKYLDDNFKKWFPN